MTRKFSETEKIHNLDKCDLNRIGIFFSSKEVNIYYYKLELF